MKIFYVKKDVRHKDYYFCGFRILRLSSFSHRQLYDEINDVFDYIRACADLSKMPAARGLLRKRQLGMLKILQTTAEFCKRKNIKFWLDYGTLLGAVRHKGFIPWDDDADISMLRDDYEKFVDLFNTESPDINLKAEWYCADGVYNMIKIRHKNIPCIWLDIFPCDLGYKKLSLDEAIKHSNEIKNNLLKNKKKLKHIKDVQKLKNFFVRETQKLSFIGNKKSKKPQTVFYGLDFVHERETTIIYDYDMFFPLKMASFEGKKFPVPNKSELYLTYNFGDYLGLPSKISMHKSSDDFDLHSILALDEYIEKGANNLKKA